MRTVYISARPANSCYFSRSTGTASCYGSGARHFVAPPLPSVYGRRHRLQNESAALPTLMACRVDQPGLADQIVRVSHLRALLWGFDCVLRTPSSSDCQHAPFWRLSGTAGARLCLQPAHALVQRSPHTLHKCKAVLFMQRGPPVV